MPPSTMNSTGRSKAGCVAAVLALAACSHPPKTCEPTGVFFVMPNIEAFGVAGETLSVALSLPARCPSHITPRVSVSVLDPGNLEVPLGEGEPTRDAVEVSDHPVFGVALQTVVRVRAGTPGVYHFTARFEPDLGLVQRDVVVAEDHRDDGVELRVPGTSTLRDCPQIDVTAQGRPLCLRRPVRLYERDGGALQTLSLETGAAARVGDVLWVAEPARLMRYVETASGFVASPDAGSSQRLQDPVLVADDTGAFLTQNGELWQVVFDGGFVESLHGSPVASSPVAAWKQGDEYVVLGEPASQVSSTLCSGRFHDAGSCSSIAAARTPLRPLASEPAGVWAWFDDGRSSPPVRSIALRTGASQRELPLPATWSSPDAGFSPWDTGAVLVSLDGQQRMLLADHQGMFVLQKFTDLPLISVTSRWLALRAADGDVLIYRR